jgi:hypothetical protein
MGLGIGNCCCGSKTWSPPPYAPCADDFCCDPDVPASFTIELTTNENDQPCYDNCEACDTTPFDMVLSPGTASWPYIDDCEGDISGDLADLTTWFETCNDDCVYGDYVGSTTLERDCQAAIDGVICEAPPADNTLVTSVSQVMVFLRLFKDCCFKMVIFTSSYPSSGGTIKVDPDDPNNTVDPFGCWSLSIETYTGTAVCCGDATMTAGTISGSCVSLGTATSGCSPVCIAALSSTTLTMTCV